MLTIPVAINESVYSLCGIMLADLLQRQLSARLRRVSVAGSAERAERRSSSFSSATG